jgi:hypothetical protein
MLKLGVAIRMFAAFARLGIQLRNEPKSGSWPIQSSVIVLALQLPVHAGVKRSGG